MAMVTASTGSSKGRGKKTAAKKVAKTATGRRSGRKATPPPAPSRGRPPHVGDASTLAIFRRYIDAVCDLFGVAPESLVGRVAQLGARATAVASLRKLALGAVAMLGRDLGLSWSSMVGEHAIDVLVEAHRTTLTMFHLQFGAWSGIDVDGARTPGEPAGAIATFVRDRYLRILRDALAEAGKARKMADAA